MTKYLILMLFPVMGFARDFPESHYQNNWCKGQIEYVLPDRSRVDCLTDTHAIEIDFADKWAESIGQALYYASETGRKPGVALISENPAKDMKYIERWHGAARGLNIKLWIITNVR